MHDCTNTHTLAHADTHTHTHIHTHSQRLNLRKQPLKPQVNKLLAQYVLLNPETLPFSAVTNFVGNVHRGWITALFVGSLSHTEFAYFNEQWIIQCSGDVLYNMIPHGHLCNMCTTVTIAD